MDQFRLSLINMYDDSTMIQSAIRKSIYIGVGVEGGKILSQIEEAARKRKESFSWFLLQAAFEKIVRDKELATAQV
jgi:hypothetical protein